MRKIETQKNNYIGSRFGLLTITDIVHSPDHPWFLAICRCDCGNGAMLRLSPLIARNKKGVVSSCGCHRPVKRRKNLEGMQFGNITVRRLAMEHRPAGKRGAYWECECGLCGRIFYRDESHIVKSTLSCGCANKKGAPYHQETGRINSKKYVSAQIIGGTNICQISVPDEVLRRSNTSGMTGVCYSSRDGRWRAEIAFCGRVIRRNYKDFEAAVRARYLMREARNCALEHLKALPNEMAESEKRISAIIEFEKNLATKGI